MIAGIAGIPAYRPGQPCRKTGAETAILRAADSGTLREQGAPRSRGNTASMDTPPHRDPAAQRRVPGGVAA